MTTDNVMEMTPEQLHAELAATKRVAQLWFRKAMRRKQELAQAHTELADACAMRDALADEANELEENRDYNASLVESLRGQLKIAKRDREFWFKECHEAEETRDVAQADLKLNATMLADQCDQARQAENERDEWRKKAQEQSDEVQESWLSPVVAEGLKRQLARMHGQLASIRKATDWLWGFWDGNTLVAKSGYEDDIREAWGRLLKATDSTDDAMQLQERLATLDAAEALLKDRQGSLDRACIELDAAEAALADCGIGGIFAEFDGPADAIMQMAARIEKLEDESMIEVEITGKEMVEALQSERALRQVAETGERAARKLLSQAIVAQADAELAAHVRSKACDELTQTMHTERRLRRKAERRAETAEAANRVLWDQDTERAEALAQLVTPELAALLEGLARVIDETGIASDVPSVTDEIERAFALAARIREALALETNDEG